MTLDQMLLILAVAGSATGFGCGIYLFQSGKPRKSKRHKKKPMKNPGENHESHENSLVEIAEKMEEFMKH